MVPPASGMPARAAEALALMAARWAWEVKEASSLTTRAVGGRSPVRTLSTLSRLEVGVLRALRPKRRQELTAVWEGVLICCHARQVYEQVRTRSSAPSWKLYQSRARITRLLPVPGSPVSSTRMRSMMGCSASGWDRWLLLCGCLARA